MQNFLKVKLSMIFEKFGIKSECPVILGYLIRFSPGVSDSEVEKYPKDAQLWSHLRQVILFLNVLKSLIQSTLGLETTKARVWVSQPGGHLTR